MPWQSESPDYHAGRAAARADIEAGRDRAEAAELLAPVDWLRGYDDQRAVYDRLYADG
jgi:hypothetical protein